jgi:hypothetical protein
MTIHESTAPAIATEVDHDWAVSSPSPAPTRVTIATAEQPEEVAYRALHLDLAGQDPGRIRESHGRPGPRDQKAGHVAQPMPEERQRNDHQHHETPPETQNSDNCLAGSAGT